MAYDTRWEPANVSGAGIVLGVFAALVTQLMLSLLVAGLGLTAADTATVAGADGAEASVAWSVFAGWAISGIIAAFAGGAVAGWMAGAVDGSPGFHGLAAWAVTTVVIAVGASLLAGAGTALGAMAGPAFDAPGRGQDLSPAELEAAADMAGQMAIASFIALAVGAIAAYFGAQMAAHREVRLHPHEHRI
jgi:hypothetical protein